MKDIELASALRSATSNMHKRLRKQTHSADNLSITEITTLSYLFRQKSLTPSELADLLKIKTQSMSQVLSRMQDLRLINRSAFETDKRKTLIALTDYGEEIIEKSRYERDEWLTNAIEQHLSVNEKKLLSDAINLIERISNSK
jgi:DNA-binding MarR family transcriptional regulator